MFQLFYSPVCSPAFFQTAFTCKIWPRLRDSECVSDLEGVFPGYVVIHRQHGDVEAGQEDTSQDSLFLLIWRHKDRDVENISIYSTTAREPVKLAADDWVFISAGVRVNRQSGGADGKTAGLCASKRVNEVVIDLDSELYHFDCRLRPICEELLADWVSSECQLC